jgi:hypothetical protein
LQNCGGGMENSFSALKLVLGTTFCTKTYFLDTMNKLENCWKNYIFPVKNISIVQNEWSTTASWPLDEYLPKWTISDVESFVSE